MESLVMAGFQYPENPDWSVQEDEREGMLDTLKGIKRMWFLIRILQFFSPSMQDIMRGFIFEEDGKPVGLINYMSPPNRRGEWMIANVTVLPEYRRRGIARKLVEATLDTLRKRKAKLALLQVIEGNLPAFNLYKELGFEPYVSETQYDCLPETNIANPSMPEGWSLSPLSESDWRTRYKLALQVTPQNVRQYEPVAEKNFKLPIAFRLVGRIIDAVSGTQSARLVLRTPSGEVAGIASYSLRTKPGGVNRAGFVLHPDHANIAPVLVQTVLARIQQLSPGHRIETNLTDWQTSLSQAAGEAGCIKRLSAHRMGLKFAENG
jgi:ribosomal protein S18 acetylase RimI-like enzyme